MTQIEVPDWVVDAGDAAIDTFAEQNTMSMFESRDAYHKAMLRSIINAALGAWVVPAGYRALGKPCSEGTQYIAYTHNPYTAEGYGLGGLTVDAIFTLRQEKPE